jgi:hypothetical protein
MKLTVEGLEKERDFYFGENFVLSALSFIVIFCRQVEGCGGYVPRK